MFNAFRSVRTQPPTLFSLPFPYHIGPKSISGVRFQQAPAGTNQPDKMDQQAQKKPNAKPGDVMSDSFGEGYSTRSDEEGFGGIYGGNQSLPKGEEDKIVHGNSPEYDKSQGSEVKEKEKSRHQTKADS